ncbi:unnamed protein product [Danaus chrysippus]|uniref:(African queen) hypothetical protein n=1 Tax=Danaus chrysippus TaxID=151541 RepID=A0A8J2QSV8_9NEOP|nr:unnamed protein product [Danaus chrysippus]
MVSVAMQCKEHLCQHGYNYETYYLVESDQRKIVRSDPSITFEMHIAILAASNGHILLSTVSQPDAADPVYEIVVGGGGNKFTELRGNLKRNAKASAKTVGILSTIEFRAFYIKITEDGLIEFGREGDILPILSYQDMDPINIHYFSFAAWNGVEAKFLYDCPIPLKNATEVPSSDSVMVEPKMSNSDMLKRSLLLNRDPNIAPRSKVTVQLGVKITSITYDPFETKLRTGLSVVRKWTDDSMAWNPLKFNGTSRLTFRQGQIWSPSLSIYNSDTIGFLDAKNSEPITMFESGETILHMQTTIQTWCLDYSDMLTKWPHDEYDCVIVIEPWENHEDITFQKLDPEDMKATSHIYETINNDYGESNEDEMETSGIRNIEAMQSDNKEYNESVELAEAIDKILFFIYSMTFAVMLALHF